MAAFRPEVKAKLVETGLLMPTVQLLFRKTSKRLKSPDEFLTYKAHPTVFEGSWVDDLALVKAAHDITTDKIPPMVQMKVVSEDEFQSGMDYFDPGSEKLADTPCVIARVWRAAAGTRKMTVSAEASFDVNKRPLTYKWVVLRGDADKIKIEPKNKEGSVALLTVPYLERRPIYPGAELESNRVDIGVFVDNGAYPSAPGFVTFCTLDTENRVYGEQGRIREIGYGAGEVVYTVTDWSKWIAAAQQPAVADVLRLSPTRAKAARRRDAQAQRLGGRPEVGSRGALKEAESRRQKAIEAAKKDPAARRRPQAGGGRGAGRRRRRGARTKDFDEILDAHYEPMPLRRLAEKRLREAARSSDFMKRLADSKGWAEASPDVKRAIDAAKESYVRLGYDVAAEPASEFGRTQRERTHALALSRLLFPGWLNAEFRLNFVDRRETAPKFWRDVYRYDAAGGLLGWTRYNGKTATEYGAQGLVVRKKDELGRCVEGSVVEYRFVADKTPNSGTIQPVAGDVVVTIRYADDRDRTGIAQGKEGKQEER